MNSVFYTEFFFGLLQKKKIDEQTCSALLGQLFYSKLKIYLSSYQRVQPEMPRYFFMDKPKELSHPIIRFFWLDIVLSHNWKKVNDD